MAEQDIEKLRTRAPEFVAGYTHTPPGREINLYYVDPMVLSSPAERDAIFAALDEARADAREAIAIGLRQETRFTLLRRFLEKAQAECARLRKALEFYGDRRNWTEYVADDGGEVAREALAATSGDKDGAPVSGADAAGGRAESNPIHAVTLTRDAATRAIREAIWPDAWNPHSRERILRSAAVVDALTAHVIAEMEKRK